MSYMTISSQGNHHFSLCSYFHAHPTTLLLQILGGPMHGPSPHLKFWGGRPPPPPLSITAPPVPPKSPPLLPGVAAPRVRIRTYDAVLPEYGRCYSLKYIFAMLFC